MQCVADPRNHTITIDAVADPPIITALPNVTGPEDTAIPLPGLSATLVDTVTTNGEEILSVVIRNVPEGSQFNAGSNNGDGSWYIPTSKLSSLTLTPPTHFAGIVSLEFAALSLELSNGDEANSTKTIQLTVTPVADPFLIVAKNVVLNATGSVNLDLNIRLDDSRGNLTGEIPAEIVTLTFTNVPVTTFVFAKLGGRVFNPAVGQFVFTGTQEQANALSLIRIPSTVTATFASIGISGTTQDGSNVLNPPVTDTFDVTVQTPSSAGINVVASNATNATNAVIGGNGNDILRGIVGTQNLTGGAGHDQILGGPGADMMTGGSGRDVYTWVVSDVDGSVDTITDFVLGEDQLNFTALTAGAYNPQTGDPSALVQVSKMGGGNNALVKVKQGSTFVSVVQLWNQGNLTLSALLAAGGLLM